MMNEREFGRQAVSLYHCYIENGYDLLVHWCIILILLKPENVEITEKYKNV